MDHLLYKTVERLLAGDNTLSRNRNFATFEDPRMKRAMKIARHLTGLRADVVRFGAEAGEIRVEHLPKGNRPILKGRAELSLKLELTLGRSRITVFLNEEEWRLLRQDAEVAALLDGTAQEKIAG